MKTHGSRSQVWNDSTLTTQGAGRLPFQSCLALIVLIFIVSTILAVEVKRLDNPFYAMDTNIWTWKDRTPEEVASLFKDLGYDGYGHGGVQDVDRYLSSMKARDLRVFNTYVGMDLDAGGKVDPAVNEVIRQFGGTDAMLWLFITSKRYKRTAQDGDDLAIKAIRELADFAHDQDVKIALYPHTNFYVETVEDAIRIVKKVNRRNVGVTFNLCHHLKVVGAETIREDLKTALPYLFQVSINGTDAGDTRQMNWDRLIQPLGSGTFRVYEFVALLRDLGYRGPIGLQGYGITGDPKENLKQSITTWKQMQKRYALQNK
ncbi:MAG: sugar phosphate isomerase/epimerase [Sedimentisphaerales bacterium]|nr:sugar phosphate isomerase/epimerase [Sedimentisphaerales bacterium]